MKWKQRGNTRCLHLHVLINTDPKQQQQKLEPFTMLGMLHVWPRTSKDVLFGAWVEGQEHFLNMHQRWQRPIRAPKYCASKMPSVVMETHHYIELVLLWTVTWKIFTFPFLSTACGVTNIAAEWAWELDVSECLCPSACCYYSHQGELRSD